MVNKPAFTFSLFLLYCILLCSGVSALELGPYNGRVFDSQTGDPIAGASVLIYWVKAVPGFENDELSLLALSLVTTNDDGEYVVNKFTEHLGISGHLDSTHMIIYQPSYQAYIKGYEVNADDNVVQLERIPPDFDHQAHYRKIVDSFMLIDDEYEYVATGIPSFIYPKIAGPVIGIREFLRRVEWEDRRASGRVER